MAEELTDPGSPIRKQSARLLRVRLSRRLGTLLLYPDQLVFVHSQAAGWAARLGFAAVAIPSYAVPPHTGPGALGALIGVGGGSMIGAAVARNRAAAKVAAGGADVTALPLGLITRLEIGKIRGVSGWLGGQSLAVTAADGAGYRFAGRLGSWSADLAQAFAVRGHEVRSVRGGLVITAQAMAGVLVPAGLEGSAQEPPAGSEAGEPPGSEGGGPPGSVLEGPAGPGGRTGVPGYLGTQAGTPQARRRGRLIAGLAGGFLALAGTAIAAGLALHGSSAGAPGLPGTLLGLRQYTGPGVQAEDARLARQLAAGSNGALVHVVAAYYGDPSGTSPALALAEGRFCDTCAAKPAIPLASGMLADSPAGARTFPPGTGGGALVCFSFSAQGQTGFVCSWLASKARTGISVTYVGEAVSGLADAAAKTRQILALIEHQPVRR